MDDTTVTTHYDEASGYYYSQVLCQRTGVTYDIPGQRKDSDKQHDRACLWVANSTAWRHPAWHARRIADVKPLYKDAA